MYVLERYDISDDKENFSSFDIVSKRDNKIILLTCESRN